MRYDSNINWLRIVTTALSINRQQHINIINIFGKRRFYHVSIMDITLNRYLRIKNYDIDNVQLLFKYNFRYAYLLFKITIKLRFKGTRKRIMQTTDYEFSCVTLIHVIVDYWPTVKTTIHLFCSNYNFVSSYTRLSIR